MFLPPLMGRWRDPRRQDLLRVSPVEWADQGPLDFHAVAFDLLADVATLPPSTKSLQARGWGRWGSGGREIFMFFFFKDMMMGKNT